MECGGYIVAFCDGLFLFISPIGLPGNGNIHADMFSLRAKMTCMMLHLRALQQDINV